jgi:hypothetical protein
MIEILSYESLKVNMSHIDEFLTLFLHQTLSSFQQLLEDAELLR